LGTGTEEKKKKLEGKLNTKRGHHLERKKGGGSKKKKKNKKQRKLGRTGPFEGQMRAKERKPEPATVFPGVRAGNGNGTKTSIIYVKGRGQDTVGRRSKENLRGGNSGVRRKGSQKTPPKKLIKLGESRSKAGKI